MHIWGFTPISYKTWSLEDHPRLQKIKNRLLKPSTLKTGYKVTSGFIRAALESAVTFFQKAPSQTLRALVPNINIASSSAAVGCGFVAIIMSIGQSIQDIRTAKSTPQKTQAALKALSPLRPNLLNLSSLVYGTLTLASTVGSTMKTLSKPVLTNIAIASATFGVVTGVLTIALGVFQMGKGVYDIFTKHKKRISELTVKIHTLEEKIAQTTEATTPLNQLLRIQYRAELKKAKLARIQSIFFIAAGAATAVCGALVIAAPFTHGTSLTVVATLAATIAVINVAISITAYVIKKKEKRAIAREVGDPATLTPVIVQQFDAANTPERLQILRDLDIPEYPPAIQDFSECERVRRLVEEKAQAIATSLTKKK